MIFLTSLPQFPQEQLYVTASLNSKPDLIVQTHRDINLSPNSEVAKHVRAGLLTISSCGVATGHDIITDISTS